VSNTVAIAAVTSTIRYVLDQALGGVQPGQVGSATVTTLRPDQVSSAGAHAGQPSGLNVYLYQVTPNHAWNLTDLPTRRSSGELISRPVAAIDLNYLISAFGDDAALEPHRLIARAVLALSVNQVLTRDLVGDAVDAYHVSTNPDLGFLSAADLADEVELVKLAPTVLSLEELSRLWAALSTPYLLSVAYTATVLVLEAEVSPRIAAPVLARATSVDPITRPVLLSVDTNPPGASIAPGVPLRLTGSGLRGPVTLVQLAGTALTPAEVRDDTVTVEVTADVPAGPAGIALVQQALPSPPQPTRVLARSNVLPILIRPAVTSVTASPTTISVEFQPALRSGQRAEVDFVRRVPVADQPNVIRVQLAAPARGDPPSTSADIQRTSVPDGEWLVRLIIDGADSLLTASTDVFDQPLVTLT
jgi:hypothetical protein